MTQKTRGRREMLGIDRQSIAWLGAFGLWVCATACGPGVVILGARGGASAEGPAAISGSGGAAGEPAAGRGGQASTPAGAGAAGAAATSGAGAQPSVQADAGATPPPDAGISDSAPDPSPGCGTTQSASSDGNITLNGATANYVLDLATGYDPNRPYPLIISFRGAYVTAAAFRRYLDLPAVVGADGIVVNMDCADGAGTWDLQRDLRFFDALLEKIEASYCIDRRRVFVVGHATGATFASSLVCMRGSLLRGLGSLSGTAPNAACAQRLPVWISQGDADPNVELGRDTRDYWVQQNQCNASLTTPVEPAPCVEYQACGAGLGVRYCEYSGTLDLPSFAADGVWAFLKAL